MPLYNKLFNCVLDTGFIPTTWLEGVVIPIFKNKGDPKSPSNYRPITILSCLGKLFTAILNNRLTAFLDNNKILEENQAGFRKEYSCTDHIFTLHALFEILRKGKKKLFAAFIDFSQAFDKVWRAGLWHKLLQNQVNGKFLNVILNMYDNIKSCVKHNGSFSPSFISEIGVRQGENLSPVLFSLFLNDLQLNMCSDGALGVELKDTLDPTLWLKLLILLYADDTVILSDNQTDFQNNLTIFDNYCNNWHLNVNVNKTKIMIFGARKVDNYRFTLGDRPLEITDKYHYLGVTFSSNGSFLNARKHIVEQANKAMHYLFTRINNTDLPLDLALKLFDHTVLPILTYGSEVFGFENIDILERIHSIFLRKITNSKKTTPLSFLYGELGRYPILLVIKTRVISFWNRLITSKHEKFSLKMYKYMVSQTHTTFKWPNKIKEILLSVGRPDLWENQFQIQQTNVHKTVKRILIDQYKQEWHEQLQLSNKGKIYNSFKAIHEFESYLKTLPKQEYLPLLKFRTANHRLPVETGRYDGTPLEDRKCPLCDSDQVGSEKHYLFDCHYFHTIRQQYLTNHLNRHEMCIEIIFTITSIPELKQLSAFVKRVMRKFVG